MAISLENTTHMLRLSSYIVFLHCIIYNFNELKIGKQHGFQKPINE
jgi:hypothetical protein